jgi:hypothetical protein
VAPEVAPLEGDVPDPAQPERGQREQDGHHEGAEQIASAAGEVEALAAEVGVRHQERLARHQEERIVEAEGQPGEKAAEQEDLQQLHHPPPEREADPAPRGPAEPVAPRAHHRDREEGVGQYRHQERGHPPHRERHVEHVADRLQDQDRHAEDQHRLDGAHQQLAGRSVIGEAVALELALAREVGADARLGPEVVDPDGDDRQQHVDDVDAEEGAPLAVEDRAPDARGGLGRRPGGRRGGGGRRGRQWRRQRGAGERRPGGGGSGLAEERRAPFRSLRVHTKRSWAERADESTFGGQAPARCANRSR